MTPAAARAAAVEPRRRVADLDTRIGVAPTPGHGVEARPDLEVVTPRRQRRSWQVGTVAGVVLFVALFAVAGFQTLIVSSQKNLDELNRGIGAAATTGQRLDNQLAELQSPQRITTEATQRLGMLSPPAVGYLQPGPDDEARASEVPEPSPPPTTAPPPTTPKSTSSPTTPKISASSSGTSGTSGTGGTTASAPAPSGSGR